MTGIGEQIRARTWDDYVGQEELKVRLRKEIEAAIKEDRMLPHMLFEAPPGMGKTTLARIVADEVGDDFHSFKMPISEDKLIGFISKWDGGVLLLDEIHAAPKRMQEMLLTPIEDGYIEKDGWTVKTGHISFFAATTEAEKVIKPLWDRFLFKPRFAPYTDEEMCQVIAGMARRAEVEIDQDVIVGLGRAAGATPRIAGSLVAAARVLRTIDEPVTVESVLSQAGVDKDGLTDRHVAYLQAVADLGRTAGMERIRSFMQLDKRVIEDLERLLYRRGFIKAGPNGRSLTALADEKLAPNWIEPNPIAKRHMRKAS